MKMAKTIMFIPDIMFQFDVFRKSLEKDGYIAHNLLEISEKGMYSPENIEKVLGELGTKPDLVCIDGMVEFNHNTIQAIRPDKGEKIYDGKIMLYPSVSPLADEDAKKHEADFGLVCGVGYETFKEALEAIFNRKPIPDGFGYNPKKYDITKEGILVPLTQAGNI